MAGGPGLGSLRIGRRRRGFGRRRLVAARIRRGIIPTISRAEEPHEFPPNFWAPVHPGSRSSTLTHRTSLRAAAFSNPILSLRSAHRRDPSHRDTLRDAFAVELPSTTPHPGCRTSMALEGMKALACTSGSARTVGIRASEVPRRNCAGSLASPPARTHHPPTSLNRERNRSSSRLQIGKLVQSVDATSLRHASFDWSGQPLDLGCGRGVDRHRQGSDEIRPEEIHDTRSVQRIGRPFGRRSARSRERWLMADGSARSPSCSVARNARAKISGRRKAKTSRSTCPRRRPRRRATLRRQRRSWAKVGRSGSAKPWRWSIQNNLDVEVDRFAPYDRRTQTWQGSWGAYDPTISADMGYDVQKSPPSTAFGATRMRARTGDRVKGGGIGIDQLIPYHRCDAWACATTRLRRRREFRSRHDQIDASFFSRPTCPWPVGCSGTRNGPM